MKDSVRKKIIEEGMRNQLLFIEVIDVIKKAVADFDGKVINKNLQKTLWNAIDREINQKEKKIQYVEVKIYAVSMRIILCASNDVIEDEGLAYPVEDKEISFMFMLNTICASMDEDKWKLDASKVITYLEDYKVQIESSYKKLAMDKEKVEEMMADLRDLKSMYETFEKNYGYRIREVYGCLYELKDCNSPYYRNPEV